MTATTPQQLVSGTWVDLGAGPMVVEVVSSAPAIFQIADSMPNASDTNGFGVAPGVPTPLQTTAHVYATAAVTVSSVISAPISSSGGAAAAKNTFTARNGSIAVGGTAQQLMAANASRAGYAIENLSTTDLYIQENATAATSATAANAQVRVPAGGYYNNDPGFCPQGILSILGATTSQAFLAKEW